MLLTAHSGEKAKALMMLVASLLSPSWRVEVQGIWIQCMTLEHRLCLPHSLQRGPDSWSFYSTSDVHPACTQLLQLLQGPVSGEEFVMGKTLVGVSEGVRSLYVSAGIVAEDGEWGRSEEPQSDSRDPMANGHFHSALVSKPSVCLNFVKINR